FDLVASFPPLPHFERADRNPINRQRLQKRLTLLELEDREVVYRAWEFLAWQRQPAARTDHEMVSMYESFRGATTIPALREMVDFRMTIRTILAAMRRKRRGADPPAKGESWGIGPWVLNIQLNWNHADFRMAGVFPWLPKARELLEASDALGLDRLVLNVEWKWLDSLVFDDDFGFEVVLAYLFQWDIL
ncbi:MAG: DUF2764 family protein, partial [bacterium]|nr:DUF2764 family protein [bacterium]